MSMALTEEDFVHHTDIMQRMHEGGVGQRVEIVHLQSESARVYNGTRGTIVGSDKMKKKLVQETLAIPHTKRNYRPCYASFANKRLHVLLDAPFAGKTLRVKNHNLIADTTRVGLQLGSNKLKLDLGEVVRNCARVLQVIQQEGVPDLGRQGRVNVVKKCVTTYGPQIVREMDAAAAARAAGGGGGEAGGAGASDARIAGPTEASKAEPKLELVPCGHPALGLDTAHWSSAMHFMEALRPGCLGDGFVHFEDFGRGLLFDPKAREDGDEQPTCAICLESITADLNRLPCGHAFHHGCVVTALQHKEECPLCRKALKDPSKYGLSSNYLKGAKERVFSRFIEFIRSGFCSACQIAYVERHQAGIATEPDADGMYSVTYDQAAEGVGLKVNCKPYLGGF